MKEFIIFVCTDSTENFFSKLRSAGLNYNLPSFFTESYCGGGGGVSNKHCLLTFFIFILLFMAAIEQNAMHILLKELFCVGQNSLVDTNF